MTILNVKHVADKFICLIAFSFSEVAEKLVHVEILIQTQLVDKMDNIIKLKTLPACAERVFH
jgi:hypothetical protein